MTHSDIELLELVGTRMAEVLGADAPDIGLRTNLRDLGLDSLELLDVGAALERDLAVRIHPDDFARAGTVEDVIRLLRTQQAHPAAQP
ncbi:acyl carrier protein [Blastococcus sp. TF02-8]|uniref:acyl carrier protein n=1 Tax=Blastococcus sp. TF02-8 TaxID=2250574 RepID=UPI000DE80D61|nr:acyl carrier protein [Blastococcus sp. TF02-8]RBY95896.1 acyl carrier protein [Blastococcus sp. TF02-8]